MSKTQIQTGKTADSRSVGGTLLDQFFHSVSKDTNQIEWQGHVVANPEPGWYLVQVFEWIAGSPSVRRLVRIEDMAAWLFYEDNEAMLHSYRHGVAREGGPYRKRSEEPRK